MPVFVEFWQAGFWMLRRILLSLSKAEINVSMVCSWNCFSRQRGNYVQIHPPLTIALPQLIGYSCERATVAMKQKNNWTLGGLNVTLTSVAAHSNQHGQRQ